MKNLLTIMSVFLLTSCTSNAQTITPLSIKTIGETLPKIRHITDMKAVGDTLLFVYETEDGYGQRFLRRAVMDIYEQTLNISPEFGKKDDGYYTSYMPYPFLNCDNNIQVVSQDDCEIYNLSGDSSLSRTKKYLMDSSSSVPFPLSQYVQDVYAVSPDSYVFIGREPNGGPQYAMTANTTTQQVDTIRKIAISSELTTWMPNAGELTFSSKYNRLAFAYRLHPIIDIFGMDGRLIKQLRLAPDTFDSKTLEEADFEELNPLHTVDITATPDYIYALYWGCKYLDAQTSNPTVFKIDWNGNIVNKYTIAASLYKVSYSNDFIIGWSSQKFIKIPIVK